MKRGVDTLGGLAVGLVFGTYGLGLVVTALTAGWFRYQSDGRDAPLTIMWFTPAAVALVAAAVVVVAGLASRPWGWPTATLGAAVIAGVFHLRVQLAGESQILLLGVGLGLVVGGLAWAYAAAAPGNRAWIAGAVAAGTAMAPTLGYLLGQDRLGDFQLWYPVGFAAVLLVVSVLAWFIERTPGQTATMPGRFAVVFAIGSAIALAGDRLRSLLVEELSVSSTGRTSQRREDAVATLDTAARLAITVVVVGLFLWYAWRLAGAAGARWIVVAAGLAIPAVLMQPPSRIGEQVTIVAVGVAAGALGAWLTVTAGRWFPWDALGLLLAAGGIVLYQQRALVELGLTSRLTSYLLLTAGVGLALGAGLAGLAGRSTTLSTVDTAGLLVVGFAAFFFAGQQLIDLSILELRLTATRELHLGGPITVAVAAVLAVLLFGADRVVHRIRRSLEAEARLGLEHPRDLGFPSDP